MQRFRRHKLQPSGDRSMEDPTRFLPVNPWRAAVPLLNIWQNLACLHSYATFTTSTIDGWHLWPRSMRCSTWFPCGDSTTYQAKGGTGALGPPRIQHFGVQNFRMLTLNPHGISKGPQFHWTVLFSLNTSSNDSPPGYIKSQAVASRTRPRSWLAMYFSLSLQLTPSWTRNISPQTTQVHVNW